MAGMDRFRVLLSEGSSLTAREVVTCLGPVGYHLEALDADPRTFLSPCEILYFERSIDRIETITRREP
jgi:hypothetical protein